MPNLTPVLLSAVYAAGTPNTITLTYDRALVEEGLDKSQFSAREANQDQAIQEADAVGSTVHLHVADQGVDAGADVVSYTALAGDIRGLVGQVPALAFTDYPTT